MSLQYDIDAGGSRSRTIDASIAIGSAPSITLEMAGYERKFSPEEFKEMIDVWIARSGPAGRDVIDEAIQGLLKIRDFLGLQLDHAWGNITDEDFEERAQEYLAVKETGDGAALKDKVKVLSLFLSTPIDSATLAEIFNCRLEDAEVALRELIASRLADEG